MTQNKKTLYDLNNIMFDQLEKLSKPDVTGAKLGAEIERSRAMTGIATQIISNARLALEAEKAAKGGLLNEKPLMLENTSQEVVTLEIKDEQGTVHAGESRVSEGVLPEAVPGGTDGGVQSPVQDGLDGTANYLRFKEQEDKKWQAPAFFTKKDVHGGAPEVPRGELSEDAAGGTDGEVQPDLPDAGDHPADHIGGQEP
jgi:hypothetical protein